MFLAQVNLTHPRLTYVNLGLAMANIGQPILT
jgi:hypothetical protein